MRPDDNYIAPRLRTIEVAGLLEERWTRDKLLVIRDLTARAVQLIEEDGSRPDVLRELRSALRIMEERLSQGESEPSQTR